MRNIAEESILIREQIKLPDGLKLTADEFREGWNVVRTTNVSQLEKQVVSRGWNLIKISDGLLRCGVGGTSQEAIANALRLSLRHVGEVFNAVEVEHIELTQYPWFFLVRIQISTMRIQPSALLPMPDHYEPLPAKLRQRRLPSHADALYPQFGSAMPLLKQMLTSARTAQARQQ
jgi:hypothetical protein